MFQDKMTPKERMMSLIQKKPIDRVPVIPFSKGYSAKIAGLSRGDFYRYPQKAIEADARLKERHPGLDGGPSYGWADYGAWDFGGEIKFPFNDESQTPQVIRTPVQAPEDVKTLRVPDPRGNGIMQLVFEFSQIMRQKGGRAMVYLVSPGNCAASIIGKKEMLKWIIKHPRELHEVLRKATDYLKATTDWFVAEFGAENCTVYLGYPIESNQLISPQHFKDFFHPYTKELHEHLIARGIKLCIEHICGDHRGNLQYWRDIPIPPRSIITIGNIMSLKDTAAFFGDDYIIAGNISTEILSAGNPEEVRRECRRCIEEGKHLPGGFVLMPACNLPAVTPPESVDAMLAAAREFGVY
jgi:uroporphyrinogen decarboxylase